MRFTRGDHDVLRNPLPAAAEEQAYREALAKLRRLRSDLRRQMTFAEPTRGSDCSTKQEPKE
jgi:hypothetical protein